MRGPLLGIFFYCWLVTVTDSGARAFQIVTHPLHRRRVAASMLMQWGLEAADDLSLETCFQFKKSHAVSVVVSSSSLYPDNAK